MSLHGSERRLASGAGSDEVDLLVYLRIAWSRRRLIVLLAAVSSGGALVWSLLRPSIYESTATIITQQEGPAGGLPSSMVTGILSSIPGLSVPSLTPNRDLFIAILKSRSMAEKLVERFHLKERFNAKYAADAIRQLQASSSVTVTKEGVIQVKVEATSPQLAADVANGYVSGLDEMLARLGTTAASRQRTFIAERLKKTEEELSQVEEALVRFEEVHRAVALEDQARGAVEAAARLKGEIIAAEVKLEVMRNYATETNPELVNLKRQIEEMRRQLAGMMGGTVPERAPLVTGAALTGEAGEDCPDLEMPFTEFAELGLAQARLTRDVKVQETVYTLLTQQLEQAKIAEAREIPSLQPLDRAVPAERRSRPRITQNVMVGGCMGLLGGVLLAFVLDFVARARERARRPFAAGLAAVDPEEGRIIDAEPTPPPPAGAPGKRKRPVRQE